MYTSIIYHIYIYILHVFTIYTSSSPKWLGDLQFFLRDAPCFPCFRSWRCGSAWAARGPGTSRAPARHSTSWLHFFWNFQKHMFFCQKWNVHQKLCPGFVSGILMSDFSRNSWCQKSIMLEISTRREGFPTGASSLLEISFLWTIKRNYTPECIQPESFWHTSFDVLSSVEGSC